MWNSTQIIAVGSFFYPLSGIWSSEQVISLFHQRRACLEQEQAWFLQVMYDQGQQIEKLNQQMASIQRDLARTKQKQKRYQNFLDSLPGKFRCLDKRKKCLWRCSQHNRISVKNVSTTQQEYRHELNQSLRVCRQLLERLRCTNDAQQKESIRWAIWAQAQNEQFFREELKRCKTRLQELRVAEESIPYQLQQIVVSWNHFQKKQQELEEKQLSIQEWVKNIVHYLSSKQTKCLQALVQKEIAQLEWSRVQREKQQLSAEEHHFYHLLKNHGYNHDLNQR